MQINQPCNAYIICVCMWTIETVADIGNSRTMKSRIEHKNLATPLVLEALHFSDSWNR